MGAKRLLAISLLAAGLCLVSTAGYGEVKDRWYYEKKTTYMEYRLLNARVDYMMCNQDTFLAIVFEYDPDGSLRRDFFPEHFGIETKDKILVGVIDNRGVFFEKSGTALLDQFYWELTIIYSFLTFVSTEINTDIVAKFFTREGIPLGYFHQGEYRLWEEKQP